MTERTGRSCINDNWTSFDSLTSFSEGLAGGAFLMYFNRISYLDIRVCGVIFLYLKMPSSLNNTSYVSDVVVSWSCLATGGSKLNSSDSSLRLMMIAIAVCCGSSTTGSQVSARLIAVSICWWCRVSNTCCLARLLKDWKPLNCYF